MNAGYGGYAQQPRGVPAWVIVLILAVGLLLIGIVSVIGYTVMSEAKDTVRAERVHRAIAEAYRRMENGEELSPMKPFVETDSISTVGNDLHEMLRWIQIERFQLFESTEDLNWEIDTLHKSIKDSEGYEAAIKEIEQGVRPYEIYVGAVDRILLQFSEMAWRDGRGNRVAMEIAEYYISYERNDLDWMTRYTEVRRELADAKKKRLKFIHANQTWLPPSTGGTYKISAQAPAQVKTRLGELDKEIEVLTNRLEHVYKTWTGE